MGPERRCVLQRGFLALLLFGGLFGVSAAPGGAGKDGEALLPGEVRERPIAAGETHVYRVEAADASVLVTVEQRGIDLVLEARGPGEQAPATVNTGDYHWGSGVLLLESPGGYYIEVRPRKRSGWPGRYRIRVEALPVSTTEGVRRRTAMAAMSRAGQQAFAGTPKAKRKAVIAYREALEVWHALGERRWEAEVLQTIAVLEKDSSELGPAVEDALRVVALWRELGDPYREAFALSLLAVTRLNVGQLEAAREPLRSSLDLWQFLGERFEMWEARPIACYLEQVSGSAPAALACYEEVLARFRELGDTRAEASILNNLGGVYDALGEPDSALTYYDQALTRLRTLGDRRGEASTLGNLGGVHGRLGEWQEALRIYGQAWEILGPLGDFNQEAKLLTVIGGTYSSLGEPQRALSFLEDALKLHRESGNQSWEIASLNQLGSTWRSLGNQGKAFDCYRRALVLVTSLKDARQETVTRLRLAEVQLDQGDPSAALRELGPALAYLRETGNRQEVVPALDLWGSALTQAGRAREALPVLQEALTLRRALRYHAGEAETLHALATAERSLGLLAEARAHAEEAVARVEELRTGFVSPDLRASFLATRRHAYTLLIDLLMDRHAVDPGGGYGRTAFEVSERARARSLLDVLQSGNAGRAGSAVPGELLERRQSLRRRLSAKSDQQLKQSGAQAEALGREIETLLAELDRVEAEIPKYDPRYAAFSAPPSIGLEEVASLLDPDTLLLEYSLGEERSFLWALGPESFRSFVLPPQREIETLARRVYEELSTVVPGDERHSTAAEALGRILLRPVWADAARFRRLVVVPDAALHVLSFSALPVPDLGRGWEDQRARKPLLESHEVVYLPSATILALQRQRLQGRSPAPEWAAVLADPVFSPKDPRLAGSVIANRPAPVRKAPGRASLERGETGFERLPSSRIEAEKIAGQAPAGQVWTALDLAASRETALSGKLRPYRVVHFATHGIADTSNPERSGLVLSLVDAAGRPQEGFLGLSDIYELDLAADLVVLSGCRTALGKEVRGEGLMGLTRGFQYAGVPRVVASLWRVQDRATAELMSRFYQAMWRDGLSPAAALREAQRSLRREPRYRDPYSWAGFVLQGD